MFGKNLKESRKVPSRVNFDYGESANRGIGAAEIFQTPAEAKGPCHSSGQRHRSKIIFAIHAAKSLLEIDVIDLAGRKLPLID